MEYSRQPIDHKNMEMRCKIGHKIVCKVDAKVTKIGIENGCKVGCKRMQENVHTHIYAYLICMYAQMCVCVCARARAWTHAYIQTMYAQIYVGVDVFVTSECIHLCILCIVTQCLFWDVSII